MVAQWVTEEVDGNEKKEARHAWVPATRSALATGSPRANAWIQPDNQSKSYKEVSGVKSKRGFTLIELIAVVAIIAILAAVILPNVFGQIRKSRTSRNLSEVEDLKRASLMYFADVGRWPVDSTNNDGAIDRLMSNTPTGGGGLVTAAVTNWRGPYLDKVPRLGAGGRYSTQYDGCLQLNDVNDGAGEGPFGERNENGVEPDRFVYLGDVPSAEAADLDTAVDGQGSGPNAGAVLDAEATGENCGGLDTHNEDWTNNNADDPVAVIFIINEGS
jgi:general secretion pathway protein G